MKKIITKYAVVLVSLCILGISGCSFHEQVTMEESLQPKSIQQTTDTIVTEEPDSPANSTKNTIDFNTESDVNDTSGLKEQIDELIEIIFTAYFTGDIDTLEQYADSEINTDFQTHPDKISVDLVPPYKIKGLDEMETIEDGEAYTFWCEFKMNAEDDFYQYLTITMIKRSNGWKIQSLGLEM